MAKELSQEQLIRMIQLLKGARQILQQYKNAGERTGICSCIARTAHNYLGGFYDKDSKYLQNWIAQMLNSRKSFLGDWLLKNKYVKEPELYNGPRKYQQTRINWINWMIQELQKEIK